MQTENSFKEDIRRKFRFWMFTLIVEAFTYPTFYNFVGIYIGDTGCSGTFMIRGWEYIVNNWDRFSPFLSLNIIIFIIIMTTSNDKGTKLELNDEYGSAKFKSIEELNTTYCSYNITEDQRHKTDNYLIQKRFDSKSKAKLWSKGKGGKYL